MLCMTASRPAQVTQTEGETQRGRWRERWSGQRKTKGGRGDRERGGETEGVNGRGEREKGGDRRSGLEGTD